MTRALTTTEKRNLWLALLAGPLAWATYFTAGYLFLETACRRAASPSSIFGLPWPSLVIVALTIVTLLLIGYAGRYAYRWWRQADRPEYGRFMAQAGALLSGLFALITFLTGLPALALPPCTLVP